MAIARSLQDVANEVDSTDKASAFISVENAKRLLTAIRLRIEPYSEGRASKKNLGKFGKGAAVGLKMSRVEKPKVQKSKGQKNSQRLPGRPRRN